MTKGTITLLLSAWLILVNVSVAQVPDEIENGIKTSLTSRYGDVKNMGRIIDVNYEQNEYQHTGFPITDPCGTLKDCYLFVASTENGGLVGVYKNHNIIWDSSPIIDLFNYNTNIRIIGSSDLNGDGNVEILAAWEYGISGFTQNIWIFSWNSSSGILLNEIIDGFQDNTQRSAIWSYDYISELVDVDGDGAWEIKGIDIDNTSQTKIYSWNGQNYGDYGAVLQEYLPKNILSAKVNCKVSKSQYGLLYNYTVSNDVSSQQKITVFAVDRKFENSFINSESPSNKWGQRYPDNFVKWDVDETIDGFPFDFIIQGDSRTNFQEETDAETIFIGNYYIQGRNGEKNYNVKYLVKNSFSGKTLCGKHHQKHVDPSEFTDSLINYTNQSFELGWITNEPTKTKYNNYFTDAKNALVSNDTSSAHTYLENVLTDVDLDSSSSLSSEAYALLRYNTEYLLKQLRE